MTTTTTRPAELRHADGDVGTRIQARREELGISQRGLAFPGCTPAFVSRIEAGDRTPSTQILTELGRRLKIDPHHLAHGVEDPRGRALRAGRDLIDHVAEHRLGKLDELGSLLGALDAALTRVELEPWEVPDAPAD